MRKVTRFILIVPTRNRPAALRMSLMGLAATRHTDVLFVVSDNSDPEIARVNRSIVEEVLANRGHRYLRPAQVLPMVAHWNFALTEAPRGDYTGIVTDRMTLAPDALDLCDELLRQTGSTAVSYHAKEVEALDGIGLPAWPEQIVAREIHSKDVLADFAYSRFRKDSPRFLNSLASRESLERIVARFGKVFGGISPDYAFAFRFLDVSATYHHIDAPLLIDHSPQISNGMAVSRNIRNSANNDFARHIFNEQTAEFMVGPIPREFRLLCNVILRELEIARASASCSTLPRIDPAAFHVACARDLRRLIRLFDPESSAVQEKIEAYRKAHSLPPWSSKVRRSNLVIAVRNALAEWLGKRTLKGVARDPSGDAALLRGLLALPRPQVTVESELKPLGENF